MRKARVLRRKARRRDGRSVDGRSPLGGAFPRVVAYDAAQAGKDRMNPDALFFQGAGKLHILI